jgi:branched-chain amino acid transport system substrate-binding protein
MRKIACGLCCFVILISLSGCQKKQGAAENAPVKIGIIGPFTGLSASLGKAQGAGAELAAREINAMGGILGRQVILVQRDDEGDPTKSKNFAEELVDREEVSFIMGPSNSTCAASMYPYLTEEKMISITPIATADTIIDVVKYPYAFRTLMHNGMQAQAMVMNASRLGYSRIALVGDTSALGIDGVGNLKKWCAEYGIVPVTELSYVSDDPDMTPVAQGLADAKADCGLFWTLGGDGAKIVRALERIGYINNIDIIGYTGIFMAEFAQLAGPGSARCSTLSNDTWMVPTPDGHLQGRYAELMKKMVDNYGLLGPGGRDFKAVTAASCYDAIMLYKWAVETAGSFDSEAVKNTLETRIADYQSYYGASFKFSKETHEGFRAEEIYTCSVVELDATYNELNVKGR